MHLAGHVSVAGDVPVAVVSDVAPRLLVQGPEGGDVGVRHRVKHVDLGQQSGLVFYFTSPMAATPISYDEPW